MTTHLDSFETALLAELRGEVAARGARPAPAVPRRGRRRSAVVAAAATALGAAVLLPGFLGSPAYAVSDGPHGTVRVEVHALEDAAGLERALAEHGVRADVRYLGTGQRCAPGRYRDASSAADSATRFTVGTDEIEVEIDRRDVASGQTVVIAASRITDGVWADVGVADGVVGACRPVPLPASQR